MTYTLVLHCSLTPTDAVNDVFHLNPNHTLSRSIYLQGCDISSALYFCFNCSRI